MQEETIQDAKKKQWVRLFDIFLFAPALLYIAMKGNLNSTMKAVLVIMALGTIIYNGYFFIKYNTNT